MRRWAALFFFLAVVAGVFGFRGGDSWITETAHVLSYVFMAAFLVTIVSDFLSGGAR